MKLSMAAVSERQQRRVQELESEATVLREQAADAAQKVVDATKLADRERENMEKR